MYIIGNGKEPTGMKHIHDYVYEFILSNTEKHNIYSHERTMNEDYHIYNMENEIIDLNQGVTYFFTNVYEDPKNFPHHRIGKYETSKQYWDSAYSKSTEK